MVDTRKNRSIWFICQIVLGVTSLLVSGFSVNAAAIAAMDLLLLCCWIIVAINHCYHSKDEYIGITESGHLEEL